MLLVKRKTVITFLILIVGLLSGGYGIFCLLSRPLNAKPGDIFNPDYFIAHAGGQVDTLKYLNCREGLIQSLNRGYKYIELDLSETEDGYLVCVHDKDLFFKMIGVKDSESSCFDLKTVKNSLLYNKYHTLSVSDLLPYLRKKDFILVTDCYSDPKLIDKYFSDLKEEILVESSSIENYNNLRLLGYHPMLTIGDLRFREFWKYIRVSLTNKYPIEWIVISATQSDFRYVRLLKRLFGVKTAMYTCNNKEFFKKHIGVEADLVYTDTWQFNKDGNN